MNQLAQDLNATTRKMSAPWPFPVTIAPDGTYWNKQPSQPREPSRTEQLQKMAPALF